LPSTLAASILKTETVCSPKSVWSI
jgi:hypothetical protein